MIDVNYDSDADCTHSIIRGETPGEYAIKLKCKNNSSNIKIDISWSKKETKEITEESKPEEKTFTSQKEAEDYVNEKGYIAKGVKRTK